MENLILPGCAGPAGIAFTKCLKGYYHIIGWDNSENARKFSETNQLDEHYIYHKGFIHPQPDKEVARIGTLRDVYEFKHIKTFLPSNKVIKICQDKYLCAKAIDDLAPRTIKIKTKEDVDKFAVETGKQVWLRAPVGAGGKDHFKYNGHWHSQYAMWGHIATCEKLIASEYLPGDNWSVDTVWDNGTLLGTFTKKRISYSLTGTDNECGGSSMISECVDNPVVLATALEAIKRVGIPNGVMSVDLKGDEDNIPKVTEINPGRFMTASLIYFYLSDYNLAKLYVDHAFGKKTHLGEYPLGKRLYRQTNCLPILE